MNNSPDASYSRINKHKLRGIPISSTHMIRNRDEEVGEDECRLGLDNLGMHHGIAANRTNSSKAETQVSSKGRTRPL